MTRRVGALLVALVVLAATLVVPVRASASSDNLEYIIPAAVAGVVAVIAIIAIVMADRSEPEYELVEWRAPDAGRGPGLHLAPDCAAGPSGRPLLCW